MSLSNLFLKFGKFLVLNLGCGCMTFNFITQITLRQLFSYPCPWIKTLSAKTTKYIPKCWERSVKRKSNFSFIKAIKNSYFAQHFRYVMVKSFLKILWWRFLVPPPPHNFSLLATQLYRVRYKIFLLCQCQYTII